MREKIQDLPKKRLERNEKTKTLPPGRLHPGPSVAPRVPKRLRIRSSVLLEILEKVTDVKLSSSSYGLEKLVLLRPFKLLFTYEAKIKARLRMMEEDDETAPMGNEIPENNFGILSSGSHHEEGNTYAFGLQADSTNKSEGIEHLRLLVEFIDKDLKPLIDLRKQISKRTLCKIAFADLWHLFEHGQEVRAPASEIQIYRVLKVSSMSALHIARSLSVCGS